MSEDETGDDLVKRWRGGDPLAVEQLYARYAQRLIRLADEYLSRQVARRLDGEDVVQSVFRTFFRRTKDGQFRIDSSTQLCHLLMRITICKARAKGREHTAAKRNVR